MHLSTNFGKEIREKKSPGTNGLISELFAQLEELCEVLQEFVGSRPGCATLYKYIT